jgi:N utilization substance protein A
LRERAKTALSQKAEDDLERARQPAKDLLALLGMDEHLAKVLARNGIVTQEDLAEQAIDDVLDFEGMTKDRAKKLILAARAPWFK